MRLQRSIMILIAVLVIAVMVLQTCMVAGPPGPAASGTPEAGPVVAGPADSFTPTPADSTSARVTTPTAPSVASETPTAAAVASTPVSTPSAPQASPTAIPKVAFDGAVPAPPDRDLYDLTRRLKSGSAGTLPPPGTPVVRTPVALKIGDQATFAVADQTTRTYFTVEATLVALSPNVAMYLENGLPRSEAGIKAALDFFEQRTYPTLTRFFPTPQGAPRRPRIHGDERVTILNARIPGVGGYFSTADEYPRSVNQRSNEREMIYINVNSVPPGSPGYHATLAHEYTHLLQWHIDSGEETWINEGTAEIGAQAVGAMGSGGAPAYLSNPDIQLTAWQESASASVAHYGAAYLFMRYLADRFGGYPAIGRLLAEPADGLEGVEAFLKKAALGQSFDTVFADWVVANYLNDPRLEGGRFGYQIPTRLRPRAEPAPAPGADQRATVHQFGARYYEVLLPAGDVRLEFEGAPETKLVPVDARSGRFQWWSNRGDSVNSRLTRRLDLAGAGNPVLTFWTWFDIESDYDYAFAEVSTDGGKTWETLPGKHTTTTNPNGANYGHGYTGKSGGGEKPAWVKEEIDLTRFVGKTILLRFEYVTDDAYNANGIGIDDLRVEGLPSGQRIDDDMESEGEWQAEGFVRILNRIPQRYAVQVVERCQATTVRRLTLDSEQRGSAVLKGKNSGCDQATIVVSGLARDTLQVAPFTFRLVVP